MIVVALWTSNLVYFLHEDPSPFLGGTWFYGETIVTERLAGLQLSFKFTICDQNLRI